MCFKPNPHLSSSVSSSPVPGEDWRGAGGIMGDQRGMWLSCTRLTAAEVGTQRAFDRVLPCDWYTRPLWTPLRPPPPKHFRTIISERSRNFIPTPWGHHSAVCASHSQHHRNCTKHRPLKPPSAPPPTATHHISGCLIHFCKGNERKASCTVGWGVLLSWRELSNAIKIHAGALRFQLAEGSVGKQVLPLTLCCFHW